jgi:hypothetical protein
MDLTEEELHMGPMQAIMGGVMTIFYYAMLIAAVWKLFQAASDLGEIKNLLIEMRRATPVPSVNPVAVAAPAPTQVPAPPPVLAGPISLESAEALLREIEAESHALAAAEPSKTTV